MSEWKKSGCVLCAQNCGLEVLVKDGRMMKVRPDKANPRSEGYVCRKGLNVIYHQYPIDRLTENTHRDPIGTPLHRYVPCRVESAQFSFRHILGPVRGGMDRY